MNIFTNNSEINSMKRSNWKYDRQTRLVNFEKAEYLHNRRLLSVYQSTTHLKVLNNKCFEPLLWKDNVKWITIFPLDGPSSIKDCFHQLLATFYWSVSWHKHYFDELRCCLHCHMCPTILTEKGRLNLLKNKIHFLKYVSNLELII